MNDEWTYETAPDLGQSVAARIAGFPRYPDMTVYALRTLAHVALRAHLFAYHRLLIEGRACLPLRESFVLASNHTSHLDALCLLSALPLLRLHRAFPAAAADYFFSSPRRGVLSGILLNALPFERERKGGESLELCRQILARPGHTLVLFPEGTRASGDEIGRFRSGIGRLVAGTAIPVVPCHLAGARQAFPKGALLPRPRRLVLRIGEPRRFEDVDPSDAGAVSAMCSALRDDVVSLARASVGASRSCAG